MEKEGGLGAADATIREAREALELAELGRVVSESERLDDLYEQVGTLVRRLVSADRVILVLVAQETGNLYREFVSGITGGRARAESPGLMEQHGILDEVRESGCKARYDDIPGVLDQFPGVVNAVNAGIKSGIYVPLEVRGKVVGVLGADDRKLAAFTDADLNLLGRIADQIAGSVVSFVLQQQTDRQITERELLSEIGRAANSTLNLDDAFDLVFSKLKDLVQLDRVSISIISSSSNDFDYAYATGVPVASPPGRSTPAPSANGMPALVAHSGNSRLINDVSEVLDEAPGASRILEAGLNSALMVPLLVDGKVIGVLGVVAQQRYAYTMHDLHLLERLAPHLTGAIVNAQLHAEVAQRANEEAMLAEISRIVTSSPEFGEIFESVVEPISQLIQFDRIAIASVDIDAGWSHTRYVSGTPIEGFSPGDSRRLSVGLPNSPRLEICSELYESTEDGDEIDGAVMETPALKAGLRAGMGVNLQSRGVLHGTISVQSKSDHAYEQRDVELLQRLAAQVAGAFANSELSAEVERRALEESVLARISRDVASLSDPDDALDKILSNLGDLVPADRATIALLNDTSGELEFLYLSGTRVNTGVGEHLISPSPDGMSARVVASGESIAIQDVMASPDQLPGTGNLLASGLRSTAAVPLIWEGATIGVFGLSAEQPNAYPPREVDLVRRVGDQLTGWLLNARLQTRLERQAQVNAVMADIGRDAGSSLNMKRSMGNLVIRLRGLMPIERLTLAVNDLDSNSLRVVYAEGPGFVPGVDVSDISLTSNGLTARVYETREPIFSTDIESLLDEFPGVSELLKVGIRSTIVVPLLWESETVGILGIATTASGAYQAADVETIERAALHLAGAVVNSDLHERVERTANEEAVISNIGRLVNSEDDFEGDVYRQFAELARQLVPVERVVISTLDGDEHFVERYFSQQDIPGRVSGNRMLLAGSVTGKVVASGKYVLWSSGPDNAETLVELPVVKPVIDGGVRAFLSVPISTHGNTFGAVHFTSFDDHRFSEHEVKLAHAVSDQIAGGIAGAKLRRQASQRADDESVLARIGRVVNSSANLDDVYEQFAGLAVQLIPADRVRINIVENADSFTETFLYGPEITGRTAGENLSLDGSLTGHIVTTGKSQVWPMAPGSDDLVANLPVLRPMFDDGVKAYISVPLAAGSKIFGVLHFSTTTDHTYSDHELFLAEAVADQIAGGITGITLREQASRRSIEESALARIGRVVNSSVNLDDAYDEFAELAGQLVPSDRIVITVVDSDEHFVTRYVSGTPLLERGQGSRTPLEGSLTGHCIATGETVSWSMSGSQGESWDNFPTLKSLINDIGINAIVGVPLVVQESAFGVLLFTSLDDRPFSDHDVFLAEAVADQIAGGITGARLREEASRRSIEESMLSDISEVISSSLDLGDVFPGFAEKLALLLPADKVEVNVIDHEAEEWVDRYGWHGKRLTEDLLDRGPLHGSATERVVETGDALIVGTASPGDLNFENFPGMAPSLDAGLNSAIVAPLLVGSEVIGALFIHSGALDAYTEEHVLLARRVASMVASAVSNASLLEESERTARERGLLAEIGRLFGSSLDIDEVCRLMALPFRELVPYNRLAVTTYDNQRDEWIARYTTGIPVENLHESGVYEKPINGAKRQLDERVPIVVSDHADDDGDPRFLKAGIRSTLLVPLIIQDRIIGNIAAHSLRPGAFSQHHVFLGEQIARQIAGALDNAVLHEQTRRDAKEREIMAEIGRVISSSIDPEMVFDEFSDLVRELLPAARVSFATKEDATGFLMTRSSGQEIPGREVDDVVASADSLTDHVMRSKSVFVWSAAENEDDIARAYPSLIPLLDEGLSSLVAVPLLALDRPIGVLHFTAFDGVRFSDRNVSLALAVGAQIAGAMANADLFAQTEREARERAALAEIGRLVSSSLDIAEIHTNVADEVRLLVPFDRMSLVKIDREERTLTSLHTVGPAVIDWTIGVEQPIGGTVAEQVMNTEKTLLVTVKEPADFVERFPSHAPLIDVMAIRSLIAVPLMRAGEVFGVMHISSETEDAYSAFDLRLAERVGFQISGAIVNSDLFARTEKEARERSTLAEIGRLIGSSLDLTEIYEGIAEQVGELLPYDRFGLVEINTTTGLVSSYHSDGPQVPEWQHGGNRPLQGTVMEALLESRAGQLITIGPDEHLADRYPGHAPLARVMTIRSLLAAPLMNQGEVMGALLLSSVTPDKFSQSDLELAERVTSQISAAIVNADLFARTEQEARERTALAEIGRLIGSTLDLPSIHSHLAEQVRDLLPYDRMSLIKVDGDELMSLHVVGPEVPEWQPGRTGSIKGSVVEELVESKSGLLLMVESNKELTDRYPEHKRLTDVMEVRSVIAMPLMHQGEVIGVLHLCSLTRNAYSTVDLQLAERIASQIAGAVVNADLFARTEEQAREREQLAEIGRIVGSTMELDELWPLFIGPVKELLQFDRLAITLYDPDLNGWHTAFVDGEQIPGAGPGDERILANQLTRKVLMRREPLVITDITEADEELRSVFLSVDSNVDFKSLVAVPAVFNGEFVGGISLKSNAPNAYTEHHGELIQRVADLVAGAIANSRLHLAAKRVAEEETALSAIGRMASSSLDFGSSFDALAESVGDLIPYDRFVVMGLDPDARLLWTHFVAGREVVGWEAGTSHLVSDSQQGDTLLPRDGILIESEIDADPNEDVMIAAGLPSCATVPLIWEARTIGALSVRSEERGRFTGHHLELLSRVAQQITGAFVNAELHAITTQEAAERSTLAEIGRLVSSSLDVQEMFRAVSEPFRRLVPFDRLSVATYNSETELWTTRYVEGKVVEGIEPGIHQRSDSSLLQWMREGPRPLIISGDDDPYDLPFQEIATTLGMQSAVHIPLIVNGEMIGALVVRSLEKNVYSQRHLELSRSLGNQIAGSVANSELHLTLSDNEARNRAVVETAAIGIVTADEQLNMQTINDATLEIFGYTREDLIGQNVKVLAGEPYRAEHDGYIERYHATGEPRIIGSYREVEGRRKDGTTFPMDLEVTEVELDRGKIYTAIIRDITDRKNAETALFELTESLEQRVEDRTAELEAFSYSVSHDLRGPLAMNTLLAERLLESEEANLSGTAKKYLELMARSSSQSAELVKDLLNFSRLGHQQLALQTVKPAEIVRSVQAELIESNPDVRWTLGEMLPCDADPSLLRAVFTNLLSNACKFTASEPEPTIEVGMVDEAGEPIYFVRDNGVGFDMALVDKVFEVFERLHRPEDYPGTGAGMAIVRRIIERHGGRIWAKSEVGIGTTFFFTLPQMDETDPSD